MTDVAAGRVERWVRRHITEGEIMTAGATTNFLEYLVENGPQTRRQLEKLPFWGGVRSRLYVLVEQGRVLKCTVANPDPGFHRSSAVMAYKAPEGVFTGNVFLRAAEQRKEINSQQKAIRDIEKNAARAAETESRRIKKLEPAINKAIALLEANGFTVTPNALGQEPCADVCARSPAPMGYTAGD